MVIFSIIQRRARKNRNFRNGGPKKISKVFDARRQTSVCTKYYIFLEAQSRSKSLSDGDKKEEELERPPEK